MGEPIPQSVHAADPPDPEESLGSDSRTATEELVPLIEETASIRKREVVTGRVRVRTVADTVEEIARAESRRRQSRSRTCPSTVSLMRHPTSGPTTA